MRSDFVSDSIRCGSRFHGDRIGRTDSMRADGPAGRIIKDWRNTNAVGKQAPPQKCLIQSGGKSVGAFRMARMSGFVFENAIWFGFDTAWPHSVAGVRARKMMTTERQP